MSQNSSSEKEDYPLERGDSGISSLNSENSETNQICNLDLLKNDFEIQEHFQVKGAVCRKEIHNCKLEYYGHYELSRRHTPSMIPWVVECVKLKEQSEAVTASIEKSKVSSKTVFKITSNIQKLDSSYINSRKEIEFEHQIKNLTRFSKNRNNTKQFSYLYRHSSNKPFTCFVFQAEDEATVNRIFYTVHSLMMTMHLWNSLETPSSPTTPTNPLPSFQVKYVGKVLVTSKKAPPSFIDEAVEKFGEMSKEPENHDDDDVKQVSNVKRNSSSSISSYSSLSSTSSSVSSCSHTQQMQLLIGQEDVVMVPMEDQLKVVSEWSFKNITFCSQGIIYCNHFGFIVKNPSSSMLIHSPTYTCFIFKCPSESLVDEIMLSMKTAFQSYLEKTSRSLVVCAQCPLQQLNKLCQRIEGMNAEERYEVLCEKANYLEHYFNFATVSLYKESYNVLTLEQTNTIMVSNILRLCEKLQEKHEHNKNNNNNKNNNKNNDGLIGLGSEVNPEKSFDSGVVSLNGASFKDNIPLFLDDSHEGGKEGNFMTHTDVAFVESNYSSNSFPIMGEMDTDNISRLKVDKWTSGVKQRRHSVPYTLPICTPSSSSHKKSLSPLKEYRGGQSPSGSNKSCVSKEKNEVYVNIDKKIPQNSPIRKMFDKLGHFRKKNTFETKDTKTQKSERSSSLSMASSCNFRTLNPSPKQRGAWQMDIMSHLNKINYHQLDDDSLFTTMVNSSRPFDARSVWKKAIGDTIMLIKINKVEAQKDEAATLHGVGSNVDYMEVGPDLKEVTKVWRQLLESHLWTRMKLDHNLLLKSVQEGVPKELRGRVWRLLARQQQFKSLQAEEPCHSIDYAVLKRQLTSHQHAILIDLGRTFPTHPFFSRASGPGQASLFNILKAYSVLDTEVGYCQGLSFVAGILLMHVHEEDAFLLLKHIMYSLSFRRQYKTDMVPLQVRLYQLTRLLHDRYRDLFEHLEKHQIAPTLYAAPWFLTIFASQFPIGFVARVFDLIFSYGPDVVIKAALVLLGNHKELIQQCSTLESIVEFLKNTLPEMALIQMEKIINQVIRLDISKTLEAYEVEFHILHEELCDEAKGDWPPNDYVDHNLAKLSRLQLVNDGLRMQKMELLEQLQEARHHIRQLEADVVRLSNSEMMLKSEKKVLELERSTLLNVMHHSIMQPSYVPSDEEAGDKE